MKTKEIFKLASGVALNIAIVSSIFSKPNPIDLPPQVESQNLALNSNPNYRYGNAIEQVMFVSAYQQLRSQSLQKNDWTHKFKSDADRVKSEIEFDKNYAQKAQEHTTSNSK